jgi:hypothetical protein
MSQDAVLNKYNEGEAKFEEEVSKYLEMNWREITCRRAVGDTEGANDSSIFANGIQDFLFSVSGSTNAFIPALSYFVLTQNYKFLMVLTGSLSAMGLALLSMGITAMAGGAIMMGGSGATASLGAAAKNSAATMGTIDPVGLLGVLAMTLPVAVLFSALQFTVALFAKSYKEAQSYIGPMVIIVLMPAMIGMLPGIDLNAKLALVPLLNLSLVCKEMLSGDWHWNYIVIIFGSSCLYAAAALALAVRMFKREDVIFRA